jgi:hypothetical protein
MKELPEQLDNNMCDPVQLNGKHISCLMYADDIVLLSLTKEGLQKSISQTYKYGEQHGLEMNIKKTKIMYFDKNGRKSNISFKVKDMEIEEVKDYKYLGIQISATGSYINAQNHLYGVALKAMYKMKRYLDLRYINVKTALHLFDTLVAPILLYGCEITNFVKVTEAMLKKKYGYFEKIMDWPQEKLHLHFCRYVLGVNNKTTRVAILSELGRYPLFLKAVKQIWRYQKRCEIMNQESLVANAYAENKQFKKQNLSWVHFSNYMAQEADCSDDWTIETAFTNLKSKYVEYWQNTLFNDDRNGNCGNKMRTYRKFKLVYELEPYLEVITDYELRKCMSKFRLSNHSLEIEVGRHKRKQVKDRLCNVCKVVEDEEHFLINCTIYMEGRISLYKNILENCKHFNNLSSIDKTIYLMSTGDKTCIINICQFVYKSFKERKAASQPVI